LTPGRNDPCPCGSGQEYEKCCALTSRPTGAAGGDVPSKPGIATAATTAQLVALYNAGRFDELEHGARALLAQHADSGFLWKVLGVCLQAQGKDALSALQTAADLLPADAEVHNNLGVVLQHAGRLEAAAASYRRALALKPDYADACSNLGVTLQDLGQLEQAAASIRKALDIDPANAGAHNNLGEVLRELGKLDEAAAHFARALQLKPELADAHVNFGILLRLLGRTAQAEVHCKRALELAPALPGALVLQAELQADQGQFADAEASYRRALAQDGRQADAWAGIANVRKMSVADTAWLQAAQSLAEAGLPARHEVSLRYAIGKYFNDVKDYEQAFLHYRRANEQSRRYGRQYERQRQEQMIASICRSYDGAWLARERFNANRSARPVLVVGMPRSGTSLAEQILASHPAVFGSGELPFWRDAAQQFAPEGGDAADGLLCKLAADYLRLLSGFSPDAQRVVDKMPGNFLHLGMIRAAFPNARIIHMQRNPVDTCLSIYFQHFNLSHAYANDLDDLAHYATQYRRVMAHWRALLPPQAMLDVPYEGLVQDQEGWSRKMLEFIGLPWDPRCLDFDQSARTVSTVSNWQVRQKISTASVERWRHYEQFVAPLLPLLVPDGKQNADPSAS
jgi:tetratricopeptide (TPR) repeat protein